MSLNNKLESLRNKPESYRTGVAFGLSGGFTAIVIAVYITSKLVVPNPIISLDHKDEAAVKAAANAAGPVTMLKSTISNAFSELFNGVKKFENSPIAKDSNIDFVKDSNTAGLIVRDSMDDEQSAVINTGTSTATSTWDLESGGGSLLRPKAGNAKEESSALLESENKDTFNFEN